MTQQLFPASIVAYEQGENTRFLLEKQPLQIGLTELKTASFREGGYVILDFGQELCGSVRILTFQSDFAKVQLRFGESLTECCAPLGGTQNATNDHAIRDMTVQLPKYSDLTFGNTGFRFVRLDFFGDVQLKSIVAVNHILSKKAVYRYDGPDETVAQIYKVAKRTIDLCASGTYLWDGIKRDRLVWIGDVHPEMLALTTLYGRAPQVERSLDFIRQQTPLPGWMNRYPMYSMWWIIILADYYEKTGADAFIRRQLSYLSRLIGQMDGCVKENGDLDYPRYFVDWPTRHQPDELHGVRAIHIIAMKKAIFLLSAFGKDTSRAEGLLSRLLLQPIAPAHSKQVAGLKYFATGLTEQDQKLLTEGGAQGMSTFMSYYILKAVASFDKPRAVEMMKTYYGGMLALGATTFWEDFDLTWAENACPVDRFPNPGERDIHGDFGAYCYKGFRHSLCHGWSAGVLQFIQEEC